MPNCVSCEHRIYTMDLQNSKCRDCQLKKIAEINEQLRRISALNQQASEIYEKEIKNYLESVEQYLEFIQSYLKFVDACDEEFDAFCNAVASLQKEFTNLRYPEGLDRKLLTAKNRASNGDRAAGKSPTKGDGPDLS